MTNINDYVLVKLLPTPNTHTLKTKNQGKDGKAKIVCKKQIYKEIISAEG
jgi:hypothetical protein